MVCWGDFSWISPGLDEVCGPRLCAWRVLVGIFLRLGKLSGGAGCAGSLAGGVGADGRQCISGANG